MGSVFIKSFLEEVEITNQSSGRCIASTENKQKICIYGKGKDFRLQKWSEKDLNAAAIKSTEKKQNKID